MGWITKKSYGWELTRMTWPILSLMAFLPLPIHLFPIAFIAQGSKAKMRPWVITGIVFLVVELVTLAVFLTQFKHFNVSLIFTSVTTFVAYLACYLVGNILLIRNIKPYVKRMELSEILELEWSNSGRIDNAWKPNTINAPQAFVTQLLTYRNEINNIAIRKNVDKMIDFFKTIMEKDYQKAELLTVRHQTILSLLSQYKNLQQAKINNSVTVASKNEIEQTLNQATVAVENELSNQYEAEIMETSAEKEVYLQQLKNRNLIQ